MIDIGLLASIVVAVAIPSLFIRPWPADAVRDGVLDTTAGAAMLGLLVGRLSALALDDPRSLTNLSSVLVIRSGVEFWPGAFAAATWMVVRAHREKAPVIARLAALVPALLVGWAGWEATCLIRGGCPGPLTTFGLRPQGLTSRMFPVGLAVAAAALCAAYLLDRSHRSGSTPANVVAGAIVVVTAIRSAASFWLPHLGSGLTRQHRTSLSLLAVAAGGLITVRILHGRRHAETISG